MTLYYIAWFIAALVLVIVEMNLMSFYLMALALGAAAGGIAAYLELPIQEQSYWQPVAPFIYAASSSTIWTKTTTSLIVDNAS